MRKSAEGLTGFLGTYFDRDDVIQLASFARIMAWVVLGVYLLDWLVAIALFLLQLGNGYFFEKGQMIYNLTGIVMPFLLKPVPGFVYFIALMAVSKVLLIFLDIEDNTRRMGRPANFKETRD